MVEKARLDIEIGTEKAVQKTKQLQKEFKQMGDKGTQAGQKISQGSRQAAQGLQQTEQQAKKTKTSMAALSVSVLGLTSGFAGISDSIAGMNEKMIALEKSQFGLKETTIDLRRAEEDYSDALSGGSFKSVQAQKRAETDLLLLREKFRIETKELTGEQSSLNSEFVSLGINVGQTGLFTFIALSQMAAGANLSTAAFVKLKLATLASAFSMKTLTAAMTLVAAHPLMTIAFVAVAAATFVFSTNLFGATDALMELWDMLKQMLPFLQILETTISNLFPPAAAQEVDNFTGSIQEGTSALTDYNLVSEKTITTMSPVPDHYRKMTSDLDSYNSSLQKGTRIGDEWIKMQEKVSRFNQKKTSDSEIDPNTGRPKTVQREKSFVTRSFFNSLPPSLKGNFRISNGPGTQLTAGLLAQRARNSAINKERDRLRSFTKVDRLRGQNNTLQRGIAIAKLMGINTTGANTLFSRGSMASVRLNAMGNQAMEAFSARFSDMGFNVNNIKINDIPKLLAFERSVKSNAKKLGESVSDIARLQATGSEGSRTITNAIAYQDRLKMMSSGAS